MLGTPDAFGRSNSTGALWLYSWCTWAVGQPSLDFCPDVTWSSSSPCSAFAAVTCAYPPGAAAGGLAGWRGCGAAAGLQHMHVVAARAVPWVHLLRDHSIVVPVCHACHCSLCSL